MYVRTFHLGDVLPDFPRAALAVDGHLHHHHLHTHTHESRIHVVPPRNACNAWPIESCDTATKRPACSNNNTFCTDTLARLVWGVAVEWGYIHVAWSTWNSGLGLLPSPVSHYSLSATRGARTYPLQRASLACRHAWVLVRIGLDGSPPLSQAASHRSAAACGVCVCDASFHCAPSTSPLCSFIWRKCRYCFTAFVSFRFFCPHPLK